MGNRWQSSREKLSLLFERGLSNPLYGALTIVVGAVAGTYASVYSSVLINNFPFKWALPDRGVAITAGLLIIAFGIMFFGGQWAQTNQARRTQARLDVVVLDLRNAVQRMLSLPPITFLDEMKKAHRACIKILTTVPVENLDVAAIDEQIRTLLGWLVITAARFHMHESGARTAANIMLFRSNEWLQQQSDEDIAALRARMHFCESEKLDIRRQEGILDLIKSLSSTNQGEGIDVEVAEIAFPLEKLDPNAPTKRDDWPLLIPGAPTAFAARSPMSYASHEELRSDIKARNMKPSEIEELNRYLTSDAGAQVRSFVSIPLYPTGTDENVMPIGILNLHRNTDGLLKGEAIVSFIPVCTPLLAGLSWLLEHRAKHDPAPLFATPALFQRT